MSSFTTHNLRVTDMLVAPAPTPRTNTRTTRPARAEHGHIPALDGVRGLAVLLVLWCHCGAVIDSQHVAGLLDRLAFSSARLSTSGVDLFFVLSGFLITGILFDAKGSNHFFRNFYARRTVRIFPLYYAVLFVFLILLPAVAPAVSDAMGHPPTSAGWYWAYLSNYSQSVSTYLGIPNEHPLHLTWSLAVEEQFYLLWPAVVFFLSRKQLLKVCGGMIAFSLALRIALWSVLRRPDCWQILENFTPCRFDVLATGAAIALIARGPNSVRSLIKPAKIIGPIAGVLLIAMIGVMAKLGYRSGLIATPGYAILGSTLTAGMYGALLVGALCAAQTGVIAKFFSSALLRAFGKYSYAIYLLHLPIVYFISSHIFMPYSHRIAGTWALTLLAFTIIVSAITMLIALISWNLFEKHFLKLKKYFPTR